MSLFQASTLRRSSAEFAPSVWGDRFLSFDANSMEMDDETKQQFKELKDRVRRMIMDGYGDKLYLIESVQRLGVSYHFEAEIEQVLELIHNEDWPSDLYSVALMFRLLRQQGYRASSDVFKKFMDKNGEFEESLSNDVGGILALYEASHLRIHGEDVLEQALSFATTKLKSCVSSDRSISSFLATQVSYALKQPLHKSIPRLEHRYYIDTYQQDPLHNEQLLAFAKLDFNILQKMHLKEISILTRWWKDLDFKTKLPYARDRLVELYLWTLFVYYEPRYEIGRMLLTKVMCIVSTIDDTFDNYGTPKELEIFTKAILRWDIAALGELPKYMHIFYIKLQEVYREIKEEMTRQGKSYAVDYAKEAMKTLVNAYFKETTWYKQGYTPMLEEYLSVTLVSTAYPLLITTSFLGTGDFATKDAFEWLLTYPKSVKVSGIISRLLNDIVSHEGTCSMSIECYMNEYGVEEVVAISELTKRAADEWKDMNEECLKPTAVPMPLLTLIKNFIGICEVVYENMDGYTDAHIVMKDLVIAMLVDDAPI